jgi:ribosomal protein S18 acetylase RimI-like enzyme
MIAEVDISPFSMADYEEALALWRRTPGVGISSADGASGIGRFLERNPGLSFTARSDGSLVATCLCGHDGRRGFLYHLAVDEAFRRRGLGNELAKRCLVALKAEGIEKCHLMLIAGNETGAAFWTAAGWEKRDDIVVFSRNT